MSEQHKKSMVFASRSAQNRPFRIADRVFWSKRITGDEELVITEYQAFSRLEPSRVRKLTAEVELVGQILSWRARDEGPITPEWVGEHVGESNALGLFTYLRTGEGLKPGETFDLRIFDTPIVIEEHTFVPRGLSYAEQIRGSGLVEAAMPQTVAVPADSALLEEAETEPTTWGEARALVQDKLAEARHATSASTEALAGWLNARQGETTMFEDGATIDVSALSEPVTSDWLLRRLTMPEVGLIAQYLASGVIPDEEADAPNADSEDGGAVSS